MIVHKETFTHKLSLEINLYNYYYRAENNIAVNLVIENDPKINAILGKYCRIFSKNHSDSNYLIFLKNVKLQ